MIKNDKDAYLSQMFFIPRDENGKIHSHLKKL